MSFERHPLVAPFITAHESGYSGFENKKQLFEKIARTLHEELVKYQEQETLRQTQVNPLHKVQTKILFELQEAVTKRDLEAVSVLSAALQRLS